MLGTLDRTGSTGTPAVVHPVDAGFLMVLDEALRDATVKLERNDYTGALETIEQCFWEFCDDYLELVKVRAYGDPVGTDLPLVSFSEDGRASALATLRSASELLLRALAPYQPFVTEEAWSWFHQDSIHRNAWPQPGEGPRALGLSVSADEPEEPNYASIEVFRAAQSVLAEVRKVKSEHKVSPKAPVDKLVVSAPVDRLKAIGDALSDLSAAGVIREVELSEVDDGTTIGVEIGQG